MLAASAGCVFAQEELPPSIDSGPLTFKSAPPPANQDPKPDEYGVYPINADTVLPVLLRAEFAVAPDQDMPDCMPRVVMLSAVIGIDGHAMIRDMYTPRDSACANSALFAVKKSLFKPARWNENPIPVKICLRVPFIPGQPAVPSIRRCPSRSSLSAEAAPASGDYGQEGLEPSVSPGPMGAPAPTPVPDEHGVYTPGPGISPPVLLDAALASPADAVAACPRPIVFLAVVNADRSVSFRGTYGPADKACGKLAIDAIDRSHIRAATLNGKPVPAYVCVGVPFARNVPPTARFTNCPHGLGVASLEEQAFTGSGEDVRLPAGVKPPAPITVPDAEYSGEARRKKIQGLVVVSIVVDENGLPAAPQVVKGLGYGLDENAIRAAMQYRFQPATRDGKPVPVRITIQVRFSLVK